GGWLAGLLARPTGRQSSGWPARAGQLGLVGWLGLGRPGPAALQEVSSIESGETNGTPASGDGPDESETEPSEKLPAESPLPPGG
ncbi:MAG: hypothetical protein QGH70_14040, partial [Nitrospinota bacterium]|nr:hypothetical protein [Nitrospinota bacterium]